MDDELRVPKTKLSAWAESLLHINHHGTLVQREIESGNLARATELTERSRKRAWSMFNELIAHGADKPTGYEEPS